MAFESGMDAHSVFAKGFKQTALAGTGFLGREFLTKP
jgi:hypothetical protein